jgi:hypothetical protein
LINNGNDPIKMNLGWKMVVICRGLPYEKADDDFKTTVITAFKLTNLLKVPKLPKNAN